MMSCFMCKGSLVDKTTTFMVDLEHCIVIVKNVPSQVCGQCGEISHSNEVARQLEKITANTRTAITEIAIVNFSNMVA